jgi:hypothetical protein
MFDELTTEPIKKYIIFTNHDDMDTWIVAVDNALGYPEPLDKLVQTGAGIHGDPEIGRAQHYAEPISNADGTKWVLPFTDAVELPATAEAVEELPTDWYPAMPGV